jgi:hypothetical protein
MKKQFAILSAGPRVVKETVADLFESTFRDAAVISESFTTCVSSHDVFIHNLASIYRI